jgi:HD-like signal output (HDOD) protein
MKHTDSMSAKTIPATLGTERKTLDLLWKRVRMRGDLPGFAKAITAILGVMHGEDDREFNMTRTVLSDPVLTQRVLRLANSPMYAVFGCGINTVSRAVIVLGTESIGHLALGLKLIDGLSGARPDSEGARNEMGKAVLAGHIARQVASSASTRDAEEAVVCSMLHGLGRMMTSFYLPEYWAQIQEQCAGAEADEAQAAVRLFGAGFDVIGRAVAAKWGLPSQLVQSLQDVEPQEVGEPLDHAAWLATISSLSYRSAAVVWEGDGQGDALGETIGAYAGMLGLEPDQILGAIESARHTVREEVAVLPPPADESESGQDAGSSQSLSQSLPPPKNRAGERDTAESTQVLARGVRDMHDIAATAHAGQLMTLALETVYQGLRLDKAIAFLLDRDKGMYRPTIYFGAGVNHLLPHLAFGDTYRPDVFHATLATDKMVFVDNAQDPAFIAKLPRWWRDALPDVRSFILLPLTAHRKPVGFIYGDWGAAQDVTRPAPDEVTPLNALRTLLTVSVSITTESRRIPGL